MKISVGLYKSQELTGGDFSGVLEFARMADARGIDLIESPEHLLMTREEYDYKILGVPIDYPYFEAATTLAAIAAVTKRIRITNAVMIAPLRPAALLAKQLATIDVISRGRLDVGVGAGWVKADFGACNVPWENRFNYLFEQIRACRELWSHAPATFHGEHVQFEDVYQLPFPVQRRIPVFFGLNLPSEKNFARIAEVGDGWLPMEQNPEKLATQIGNLKRAFAARGRDPDSVEVRVILDPFFGNNPAGRSLEQLTKQIPSLKKAGVTILSFNLQSFCDTASDVAPFLDRLVSTTK